MRSDTLLSLDEFCRWAGVDPWAAAQVDRSNDKLDDPDLLVAVQYPWQGMANTNDATPAEANSRDFVVQAIRRAERLFAKITSRYPAPMQILDDEHVFPSQFEMRHGYSFRPTYRHVEAFGVEQWTLQEAGVSITQLVDSELSETFSIEVAVPDDTEVDGVHVFLPGEAATLANEIRPLDVTIDSSAGTGNWIANISGAAYLFVKPEHYTEQYPEPVPFDKTSYTNDYLQTVDIYLRSIDVGQQGVYKVPQPCSTLPCPDPTEVGVCWSKVGLDDWVFGEPASFDGSTWTRENLKRYPKSVSMNYVAGYPKVGQRIADVTKDIIGMLTCGLMGLEIPEDEQSSIFMTSKMKYFVAIQSWQNKADHIAPQMGYSAILTIPKALLETLNGLEPRRGIVQAYTEMVNLGWIV